MPINDQSEVMKLGCLTHKFEEMIQQSGGINVDELKQLLNKKYPQDEKLNEEIKHENDLSDVFEVVWKRCSQFNIDILLHVLDHFEFPDSDQIQILKLIHQYEEPHYHKKMNLDIKTTACSSRHCFISLQLKVLVCITVKQFARLIKNLFHNLSSYIHVCIVGVNSFAFDIITVILRAPKSLTADLQFVAKNNSCPKYFDRTTIIFLQIENEIILDLHVVGIN